jgi:hypothetical protein
MNVGPCSEIYHAVWSLKRGAIDPPERVDPDLEDDMNAAMSEAARYELDRPMSDEEMWRLQGLTELSIKAKVRRKAVAA